MSEYEPAGGEGDARKWKANVLQRQASYIQHNYHVVRPRQPFLGSNLDLYYQINIEILQ